jgi:hypothetical protein
MSRMLASLGSLLVLTAPAAFAQSGDQDMNHAEGGGGCVYDRQLRAGPEFRGRRRGRVR